MVSRLKNYTTLARPKVKLYLEMKTVQHESISLQESVLTGHLPNSSKLKCQSSDFKKYFLIVNIKRLGFLQHVVKHCTVN